MQITLFNKNWMRDGEAGLLNSIIVHLNDLSVKKNLKLIFSIYTCIYFSIKLVVNISNKSTKVKQLFKAAYANRFFKSFPESI